MFSIIGYCFSAFTSAVVNDTPELFNFYTLSVTLAIVEIMIYVYWIISIATEVKTEWDNDSMIDVEEGTNFV